MKNDQDAKRHTKSGLPVPVRSFCESCFNATPIDISLVDSDGVIQFVNLNWFKNSSEAGYPETAFNVGERLIDSLRSLPLTFISEAGLIEIDAVLSGKKDQSVLTFCIGASTEKRDVTDLKWYRLTITPFTYDKRVLLSVTRSDMTDAKQTADARVASENRYKAIVSAIPDILFRIDGNLRFVDAYARNPDLLLSPPDQIIGKKITEILPPDIAKLTAEHAARTLETGLPENYEYTLATPVGDGVFDTRMVSCGDDDVLAIIRDVTQQRETERALTEAETRYKDTIEAIDDALHVVDRNYRIVLHNRSLTMMCKGFGLTTRLMGESIFDVFPFLTDSIRKEYETIFRTGKMMVTLDYNYVNQQAIYTETRKIPIFKNKKVVQVAAIIRDVTQRKREERLREELISELEARNDELERFTYTVSHDLKSPLITIKGFVGMIKRSMETGKTERMLDDFNRIEAAADRMGALLEELLYLSRVGRTDGEWTDTPFNTVVEEATQAVAGQIADTSADIIVADRLPIVRGAYSRLVELVQNLLDNALRFTDGLVIPRVEIGSETLGDETVFYVRDNGIGIDEKHHDKIFGLFNILNASKSGNGIGLAIVKRIVETHGGRIWVESRLGKGATFR
ncbi:MAG: ATP-binding protein, partial [Planctomycetota bacterium]